MMIGGSLNPGVLGVVSQSAGVGKLSIVRMVKAAMPASSSCLSVTMSRLNQGMFPFSGSLALLLLMPLSDLLEWQTWGDGGLSDPLMRPATLFALEVKRKLVTVQGAKTNHGVAINAETLELDETATGTLRADIERAEAGKQAPLYDRGGTVQELVAKCKEVTGLEAPVPQWQDCIRPSCRSRVCPGLVLER